MRLNNPMNGKNVFELFIVLTFSLQSSDMSLLLSRISTVKTTITCLVKIHFYIHKATFNFILIISVLTVT